MSLKIKKYFNKESKKGRYVRNYVEDTMIFYKDQLKIISDYINEIDYFLEIGFGAGLFLRAINTRFEIDKVCGIDLSEQMVKRARTNNFILIQGEILNIPFKERSFNLIYIESLLHHLISDTKKKSKDLTILALKNIRNILKPEGFLLLKEVFYESYIFSKLTSLLVFYLLKMFNTINIPPPIKEASRNLMVSFYTRSELEELLKDHNGIIVEKKEYEKKCNLKEKIFFLDKKGVIIFLVQFPSRH